MMLSFTTAFRLKTRVVVQLVASTLCEDSKRPRLGGLGGASCNI